MLVFCFQLFSISLFVDPFFDLFRFPGSVSTGFAFFWGMGFTLMLCPCYFLGGGGDKICNAITFNFL